jgi:glycerate kinase
VSTCSSTLRGFGPQKGADETAVAALEERLDRLADRYREARGVDVRTSAGRGRAGGLAGGLAAYGARLVPGATLGGEVDLRTAMSSASLVLTGEGRVDATSFEGKVVGHVRGGIGGRRPAGAVAGDADDAAIANGVPSRRSSRWAVGRRRDRGRLAARGRCGRITRDPALSEDAG